MCVFSWKKTFNARSNVWNQSEIKQKSTPKFLFLFRSIIFLICFFVILHIRLSINVNSTHTLIVLNNYEYIPFHFIIGIGTSSKKHWICHHTLLIYWNAFVHISRRVCHTPIYLNRNNNYLYKKQNDIKKKVPVIW